MGARPRQGRQGKAGAGADASAPGPFGEAFSRDDPPILALTLWPNRPLSRRGFAWVIGIVATGLAVPLVALAGSAAAWGLLPFLVFALVALYVALERSYASGRLTETLLLWPDLIEVERREPGGAVRRWQANPAWVRLQLIEEAGPVEQYLTLAGAGRVIELGAFLSPEERVALHRDLEEALRPLRAG